jgi:multiple sugar transport system ATP-binding protein
VSVPATERVAAGGAAGGRPGSGPAGSPPAGGGAAPGSHPSAAAAGPFLSLGGVSKRLGATQALRGIDLEARADELLVVLGPTGAGKTTLLRTIAGLEVPDAGTVRMAGRDVTGLDPAARDVALVFQNFSLYPRWSVRRNLEFPLRAPGRNLPEAEIRRRIDWAAEILKISRFLDRDASRLSGGEMQRVAIGRAIVRRPRLFLMDEPLTNLDAKLREALRVELVELRRALATPMVFVTHDQAEALSMADRIVVLSEGRILQTGTPREIYERPVSPVVALQLGQPAINLVPVRRQGGAWCALDGTPLIPADATSGPAERLLGVRPEDIRPDDGRQTDGAPGAGPPVGLGEALVRVVEYIGPTTTLLCDWAGTHVHIVIPRRGSLRPGDRLRPRIDAARAILFDLDPAQARDVPVPARLLPEPPSPLPSPGGTA